MGEVGISTRGVPSPEPRQGPGGPPKRPEPILAVEDLRVQFDVGGANLAAVRGVSFTLAKGTTLGIVGESGSGKSVTARALMGLLPQRISRVTGSVRLQGEELLGRSDRYLRRYRGKEIALIFQDPMRSLNPTLRIGDQIAESLRAHLSMNRAAARERAVELLQKVRIPDARRRFEEYPHQLSGGMRQRVMVAIALSCQPSVLIADEPTTALDVTTEAQIMDLLKELQGEFSMSLLFITHDLGLAASYTDEIAVMYAGGIVEQATTGELFSHVRMPYTRALLDSVPRLDQKSHQSLPVIRGVPPDPLEMPRGCPYSPRCSFARDECRATAPPLEEHERGHRWACWFPL